MEKNNHADIFDSSVVDNAYDLFSKVEKAVFPLKIEGKDVVEKGVSLMVGMALFVNKLLSYQDMTDCSSGVWFGMLMERVDSLEKTYGEIDLIQDADFWQDFEDEVTKHGSFGYDPIAKYGQPDDRLTMKFLNELDRKINKNKE